jgi:hypothetical protein
MADTSSGAVLSPLLYPDPGDPDLRHRTGIGRVVAAGPGRSCTQVITSIGGLRVGPVRRSELVDKPCGRELAVDGQVGR